MPTNKFTESDLEEAALEWLEELGYSIAFGPNIAPDGEAMERRTWRDVLLEGRLVEALERINRGVPGEAIIGAISRVYDVCFSNPGLLDANHAFHRMLVDGVDVGDDKEVKKWMKKHPEVLQGGETIKVETVRREEPKVGRNDPCTCGSGKKYKKCCGQG